MTTSLNPAIVRIRTAGGHIVGAGFLVGQRQVLTCAHVIDDALGRPRNTPKMPQADVHLDFPLVAPDQHLTARVVCWQPSQPNGGSSDVAGLELADDPPAGASPVRLVKAEESWGHSFRAFGFPQGHAGGTWASGVIRGRTANAWLQIEDTNVTGYRVQPGFSGGAVWDEQLDGVVGMVTVADRQPEIRAAFIIPTDRLVAAWPELEHALQKPLGPLGKLNNVPELPPHFLPRPEHLESLKATVLTGTTRNVGVQGMGGIGKSVLAAALARDENVRRAFPDGVLWMTLGQTPALTARQTQIADALEDKPHAFTDVQQGRACLSELLADKDCLLILDDVWDVQHIRPFDALGPRCRMLLTTRDAGLIVALGATERRLDVLDDEQALRLLAQWAGLDVETLPPEANEIADECGNLPLALALSAAQVRDGSPWGDLLDALREADLEFLNHPHGSVMKSLQVSVDALPIDQAQRYLELAVFPNDEVVPEAAVLTLWLHASDLKAHNARKLLTMLERKALLRMEGQAPKRRLSLHALQYDYVCKQVGEATSDQVGVGGVAWREHLARLRQAIIARFDEEELRTLCYDLDVDYDSLPAQGKANKARELIKYLEHRERIPELVEIGARLRSDVAWELPEPLPSGLPALHERLLQAYAAQCPAEWPSGPDDGYYFQYLTSHLMQAGRTGELREMLLDFDWLQAKLGATDAADLIADYQLLPNDAELRLVQGAIRLSAHVLTEDKTQLPGQLLGRLLSFESPEIQAMLEQAKRWKAALWIRPLVPNLTPPGSPLLYTMAGHLDNVKSVAVTSDGRRAVSTSADGMLKVWDLERGEELSTLTGHTDWINAVAVTPDGQRAISASRDHTLKVWDLDRGEELHTLTGHTDAVSAVTVTPDGQRAISASRDHTLKVWGLDRGEELRTLTGHTHYVNAVAVTADGRWAVSASADRMLKVWDLDRGEELRTLTGHTDWVNAVAVTPNGRRAVSASDDRTLKVWDLREQGEELCTLTGHTRGVKAVAVTMDGRRVVSASDDETLKVWDLERNEELRTLTGHTSFVNAVAVTPDGQRAISASYDHTLKVWNLDRGDELRNPTGHTSWVRAVTVTSDGRWAVSASDDWTLKVWNLEQREELHTLTGHTYPVTAVAVTSDGRRVVSTSDDRTLKVWNLEQGEELHTLTGHTDWVRAVAVTPDGGRAVSASDDQTLKVWNLGRGEELRTLTGHTSTVTAVTVRPDGRQAVSTSYDHTLKVWDLEQGEELYTLMGHTSTVRVVVVTPDGKRGVSASYDKTLKVWDLERGEELHTLKGHTSEIKAVAVTPDGRWAVSGSFDGMLKVWDLERGEELRTLTGHTDWVNAVAVTPDGQWAISASNDGMLKVWGLDRGKEPIVTFSGDGKITACAIAPDGTIVAGERSGRMHFLRLEGDNSNNDHIS